MKELVEIKSQELFLINYKSKWSEYQEIVAQSTLDYYKQWHKEAEVKILESLGNLVPEVEVYKTNYQTSRCYVRIDYEVHSKSELNEKDLEVLRALKTFMSGQRTGHLNRTENVNGTYIYHLTSECDSGD